MVPFKLPFLRLYRAKAEGFADWRVLNTSVRNNILYIYQKVKRKLTLPQRA
jgi:hypothetical protein